MQDMPEYNDEIAAIAKIKLLEKVNDGTVKVADVSTEFLDVLSDQPDKTKMQVLLEQSAKLKKVISSGGQTIPPAELLKGTQDLIEEAIALMGGSDKFAAAQAANDAALEAARKGPVEFPDTSQAAVRTMFQEPLDEINLLLALATREEAFSDGTNPKEKLAEHQAALAQHQQALKTALEDPALTAKAKSVYLTVVSEASSYVCTAVGAIGKANFDAEKAAAEKAATADLVDFSDFVKDEGASSSPTSVPASGNNVDDPFAEVTSLLDVADKEAEQRAAQRAGLDAAQQLREKQEQLAKLNLENAKLYHAIHVVNFYLSNSGAARDYVIAQGLHSQADSWEHIVDISEFVDLQEYQSYEALETDDQFLHFLPQHLQFDSSDEDNLDANIKAAEQLKQKLEAAREKLQVEYSKYGSAYSKLCGTNEELLAECRHIRDALAKTDAVIDKAEIASLNEGHSLESLATLIVSHEKLVPVKAYLDEKYAPYKQAAEEKARREAAQAAEREELAALNQANEQRYNLLIAEAQALTGDDADAWNGIAARINELGILGGYVALDQDRFAINNNPGAHVVAENKAAVEARKEALDAFAAQIKTVSQYAAQQNIALDQAASEPSEGIIGRFKRALSATGEQPDLTAFDSAKNLLQLVAALESITAETEVLEAASKPKQSARKTVKSKRRRDPQGGSPFHQLPSESPADTSGTSSRKPKAAKKRRNSSSATPSVKGVTDSSRSSLASSVSSLSITDDKSKQRLVVQILAIAISSLAVAAMVAGLSIGLDFVLPAFAEQSFATANLNSTLLLSFAALAVVAAIGIATLAVVRRRNPSFETMAASKLEPSTTVDDAIALRPAVLNRFGQGLVVDAVAAATGADHDVADDVAPINQRNGYRL